MNRPALVLFVIALCFAVLIVGILVYIGINTSNQSPQPSVNVTITHFNFHGYNNPVGVIWSPIFLLNYTNYGTTNVNNVTVTITTNSTYQIEREIEVFNNPAPNYYIGSFAMGEEYALGNITVGERKELNGDIFNDLKDRAKLGGSAIFASLKSNDTLLDQVTIYLQGSQDPSDITCTYHRISSETVANDTRVVLLVTASYNRGDQVTLKYDNFYVGPIHIQNDTYNSPLFANQVVPFETGSVTIDSYNRSSTFQLTFQFPTNYKGSPVSSYPLDYHLDSYDPNFIEIIYENLLNKDS